MLTAQVLARSGHEDKIQDWFSKNTAPYQQQRYQLFRELLTMQTFNEKR